MADAPVVHMGENSPEEVAYKLLSRVMTFEKRDNTNLNRKDFLDAYAECLFAVRGHRNWEKK